MSTHLPQHLFACRAALLFHGKAAHWRNEFLRKGCKERVCPSSTTAEASQLTGSSEQAVNMGTLRPYPRDRAQGNAEGEDPAWPALGHHALNSLQAALRLHGTAQALPQRQSSGLC